MTTAPILRTSRRKRTLAVAVTALPALGVAALLALRPWAGDPPVRLPSQTLAPPSDSIVVEVPEDRPTIRDVTAVSAAAEAPWGWIVLDGPARRLAYLTEQGDLLRQAGAPGEGPGELRHPVSVAMWGQEVAVADTDGRLSIFDERGAWVRDVSLRGEHCVSSRVQTMLSSEDSLPMLLQCITGDGRSTAIVQLVARDGGVRTLMTQSVRDFASRVVAPLRLPMLGRIDGRLAFGMATESCVQVLDSEGTPQRLLCYPDMPRHPIPDSMRIGLRPLEERLRAMGVRIVIPDRFPAFSDLVTAQEGWGFRALTAEGSNAVDRVVDGRLHRLLVPDDVQLFLGRRSTLLTKQRLEGTAFFVTSLR